MSDEDFNAALGIQFRGFTSLGVVDMKPAKRPKKKKYDLYKFRYGKPKGTHTPRELFLLKVLIEFARSIDPHGVNDGDYDAAMRKLLEDQS